MFSDGRSKEVVLVSHCVLNQNSISDTTADFPGTFEEIVEPLLESKVGILQMPCPELLCLGLDRGDVHGGEREVVKENTRIRNELKKEKESEKMNKLVDQVVYQICEYVENDFEIVGMIGVNRSPSCGVNTTSKDNKETEGKGLFIKKINNKLKNKGIRIRTIGIKTSEPDKSVKKVKKLLQKE